MKKRIAAIDVGTNSVLLTIAEARGSLETTLEHHISPIFEAATITRIGEGLGETRRFKAEAIERTLSILKRYAEICREYSAEEIYSVGTAAIRKAENAAQFIHRTREECGLDIEVISGDREAELSFKAVERDFGKNCVVVDIGGGSTELISLDETDKLNITSLSLGCVTIHEKLVKSDPISEKDFLAIQHYVVTTLRGSPELGRIPTATKPRQGHGRPTGGRPHTIQLVATAGTATTLAAMKLKLIEYNHSEVHGLTLEREDVQKIIDELKVRTIQERKKLPGLEPKRADVILPGALILVSVMDKYDFSKVTVSDRGVRWGLIYEKLPE